MKKIPVIILAFYLASMLLFSCGSSKDTHSNENLPEEDREVSVDEEGYEIATPVEPEIEEHAMPDDDFTEPGAAASVREASARKHDEIDYTKPDFHPGNFPDVESMEIGDVSDDGVKNGNFNILYNNGFSESGHFNNGEREGKWEIYNRNQELIRVDEYEAGNRVNYEIIK